MKKNLLKKAACLLACGMLAAVMMTGCGGNDSAAPEGGSAGAASGAFKVSGNIWGQGVNALDIIAEEAKYTQESVGNEFTVYNDNFTADTQASNFQSMIASGTNGMMVFGSVPTLYDTLATQAAGAKVPFVIFDQIPLDQAVLDKLSENEFYVGSVGTDNYAAGANVAKKMLEAGAKTAFTLGGAVGDVVHDARLNGFKDEFTKGGGKVLAEGHCDSPSDAATKGDDLVAANGNADAIYALTGDYAIGALTALNNHKKEIPIYMSDTTKESIEYIKSGAIAYGDGGSKISTTLAGLLLANYMAGNQIKDDNGKAPYFGTIVPFEVNADNADVYVEKFLEGHPMSADALAAMVGEGVNYQTFVDFIDGYSLESLQ